jgi:hypothetical protein
MTNLTYLQENFVQHSVATRLSNLATHLTQIQSLLHDPALMNLVNDLIDESRYFIEWTVPEMDIDQAAELVDLGRFLTRWLFDWEQIWSSAEVKNQIIQELGIWSERVLQIAQSPPVSVA